MEKFKMASKIKVTNTIETWEELKKFIDNGQFFKTRKTDIPHTLNIISNPIDLGIQFYRGVEESEYRLSSTLERYIIEYYRPQHIDKKDWNYNVTRKEFDNVAKKLLADCKQKLKGRIPEQSILLNNEHDNHLENEIWSYGQHFGLSTPYLDWTKSFFVALYFAFEKHKINSQYRAIYCLNTYGISDFINIIQSKVDIGGRLIAQKGVFTSLLCSEIEELNQKAKDSGKVLFDREPLTKILINNDLRVDIMEYLLSMNIDSSTIYPDFQGAIKSCHLELDNILEYSSLAD